MTNPVLQEAAEEQCVHCYHRHEGVTMIALDPGKVMLDCCKCAGWCVVHSNHVAQLLGAHRND